MATSAIHDPMTAAVLVGYVDLGFHKRTRLTSEHYPIFSQLAAYMAFSPGTLKRGQLRFLEFLCPIRHQSCMCRTSYRVLRNSSSRCKVTRNKVMGVT